MALIKAVWDPPPVLVACGKARFEKHSDAQRAMECVLSRTGGPRERGLVPSVYFCRHCASFHWGNRPRAWRERDANP